MGSIRSGGQLGRIGGGLGAQECVSAREMLEEDLRLNSELNGAWDERGFRLVKEAILNFISTRGGSVNARHRVSQALVLSIALPGLDGGHPYITVSGI